MKKKKKKKRCKRFFWSFLYKIIFLANVAQICSIRRHLSSLNSFLTLNSSKAWSWLSGSILFEFNLHFDWQFSSDTQPFNSFQRKELFSPLAWSNSPRFFWLRIQNFSGTLTFLPRIFWLSKIFLTFLLRIFWLSKNFLKNQEILDFPKKNSDFECVGATSNSLIFVVYPNLKPLQSMSRTPSQELSRKLAHKCLV